MKITTADLDLDPDLNFLNLLSWTMDVILRRRERKLMPEHLTQQPHTLTSTKGIYFDCLIFLVESIFFSMLVKLLYCISNTF